MKPKRITYDTSVIVEVGDYLRSTRSIYKIVALRLVQQRKQPATCLRYALGVHPVAEMPNHGVVVHTLVWHPRVARKRGNT